MKAPRSFAASAPVRLDFAGGWTDVPPFSAEQGGVVVSGAIALRGYATVVVDAGTASSGTAVRIVSEDLGMETGAASPAELPLDGALTLPVAALRRYPPGAPCELRTRSEVPPGSGLGSSGALDVALVAALLEARGETCGAMEIAHRAWQIEAADAGIPGGKQDQYSAALGGFNRLRFEDPAVRAEPLVLGAGVRDALARAMLLCYTGRSRLSDDAEGDEGVHARAGVPGARRRDRLPDGVRARLPLARRCG